MNSGISALHVRHETTIPGPLDVAFGKSSSNGWRYRDSAELLPERQLDHLDTLALGRILCEAERVMANTSRLIQHDTWPKAVGDIALEEGECRNMANGSDRR